ncbi:MAG: toxic anion resistance protein [Candidatus Scatovivens sp.]
MSTTKDTAQNPINQEVAPIVKESSFPRQSSRLQELMKNYRSENNIPSVTVSSCNPLANVTVRNEVKTKTFDDLKPEQQQKVLQIISNTNYLVSGDIQTFGSAKESAMTKNAETIISKYSAKDAGEVSEPITDLVATIKSKNPKDITKKINISPSGNDGFFASISDMLSMKNAKKKMFKALAEHDSIMKNIRAIEVHLKNQQLSLMSDIEVYESMGRDTYSQISDFELYCIALNLMIDDAEAKLNELTSKGSLDLDELNQANTLKDAIDRMKRKQYTLQTVRISAIQSIPQLSVLIRGDEIICEKIDEISTLVIPLWTWQYAIAVGALKQKEALSIQKTIRGITSKLLTGNAQMLHDNMIAAQEELYAAAVAIEDLATVQEYIDDMVTKVSEVSKQASQKCVEGMKTMKAIEEKNYTLMTKSITE